MSHHFRRLALLTALAIAPVTSQAGLIWNQDEGWILQEDTPSTANGAGVSGILKKMNEARRLQEKGHLRAALGHYEEVIELHPGTPFAAESYFQIGIIYLQRSQFEKAFKHHDELLRKHPEFERFDSVISEQYAIATAIKDGKRPYLGGWMPWFKDYTRGLEYFETINYNAPYGYFSDRSLYDKGTLALELGKKEDAIDAFERIINNYPSSRLVSHAYLALARTHASNVIGAEWDQGSTNEALNFYNDFVALFPDDPKAEEALVKADALRENLAKNRLDLGLFYYENRNNPRAAAIFFNEAINAAPDSETARQAQGFLDGIRAGKKARRNAMDWIFGRYLQPPSGDFIDAPTQPRLEDMGFTEENAPTTRSPDSAAIGAPDRF